ncbi:MAG TPA: putative Ig domain-containing protein [Acidimicrobiales bacterium]|nr:putative Ig domain-containing protein [Acidimicrobiales bacterium]
MLKTLQIAAAGIFVTTAVAVSVPMSLASAHHQAQRPAARHEAVEAAGTAVVSIIANGTGCAGEFCFTPENVTIHQVGTVTWTNRTGFGHTVTRCTTSACPGAGPGTGKDPAFTSGVIAPNGTFKETFHGVGTYNYYCQIHGFAVMHGRVTVLAFAVGTASLPNGTVGKAYKVTLQAAGGQSPFHWSITAGTLPAGLTLTSAGVLSGTPTATGTSTLTFKVTDSSKTALVASKTLKLTIA